MATTFLDLDVQPDVAARIIAAADQLFQDSGKTAMPNVDAVRRKAHVNMNDASKVMRAWRRAQAASASPLPNAIPERVRDASLTLLQTLWTEASELANTSLHAAQTSWETERAEAEGFRSQLAAAFDEQSGDLQTLQIAHQEVLGQLDRLKLSAMSDAELMEKLRIRADAAEAQLNSATQRGGDLQRHIDDLRTALLQANGHTERIQREATRQTEESTLEISGLRADIAKNAELTSLVKEENALLRGQLALSLQKRPKRKSVDGAPHPAIPLGQAIGKADQPGGRRPRGRGNGQEK